MAGEEKEEYEAEQGNKVEKEQEDAEGRLERRTREGGRQKKDGRGGRGRKRHNDPASKKPLLW